MNVIEWCEDSERMPTHKVRFLDQTRLPLEEVYIETSDIAIIADAIITLKLRGAPLIGISAAYGVLLGIQGYKRSPIDQFSHAFNHSVDLLAKTRPTAKNLFGALERMQKIVRLYSNEKPEALFDKLKAEAVFIHKDDGAMCEAMGKFGAALIPDGAKILTHCNTGALATGGIGTALGVITTAHRMGRKISVYVDETRPLLQGARLTMWELHKAGVPATLITDNAAAWTILSKKIDLIIVGADRIVANGDTANKIGTYNLAVLAQEHGIPFYVVAPTTTMDVSLKTGEEITIEERNAEEVTFGFERRTSPDYAKVFSPAFDVTPHRYITAIITEKGIHRTPFEIAIREAVAS